MPSPTGASSTKLPASTNPAATSHPQFVHQPQASLPRFDTLPIPGPTTKPADFIKSPDADADADADEEPDAGAQVQQETDALSVRVASLTFQANAKSALQRSTGLVAPPPTPHMQEPRSANFLATTAANSADTSVTAVAVPEPASGIGPEIDAGRDSQSDRPTRPVSRLDLERVDMLRQMRAILDRYPTAFRASRNVSFTMLPSPREQSSKAPVLKGVERIHATERSSEQFLINPQQSPVADTDPGLDTVELEARSLVVPLVQPQPQPQPSSSSLPSQSELLTRGSPSRVTALPLLPALGLAPGVSKRGTGTCTGTCAASAFMPALAKTNEILGRLRRQFLLQRALVEDTLAEAIASRQGMESRSSAFSVLRTDEGRNEGSEVGPGNVRVERDAVVESGGGGDECMADAPVDSGSAAGAGGSTSADSLGGFQ